jgi:ribosomal 50S subunit-recycling heat shock protein
MPERREVFTHMRLDLFLKLSRLVPRRTGAKDHCDAGEVRVNGQEAKAGREVRPGDRITLLLPSREVTVEVLDMPAGRSVSKSAARELFRVIGERRFDLLGNEMPPREGP